MSDTVSDTADVHVQRDGRTDPYFSEAAHGRLMIRRCRACGHHLAPEAAGCTGCGGAELAWVAASGAGTLVSWSLGAAGEDDPASPGEPAGGEPVPILALVELAEGPWVYTRLHGVAPGAVRVGLPLTAVFVHPEHGESFPLFTAADGAGTAVES